MFADSVFYRMHSNRHFYDSSSALSVDEKVSKHGMNSSVCRHYIALCLLPESNYFHFYP